jgi:hypothetical protein
MEWEFSVRKNNGVTEQRYIKNNWIISYDGVKQEGYIGKIGRTTIVEPIGRKFGELQKGLGIPNYVVDKANELING